MDAALGVVAHEWQLAKRDAILCMKSGEEDMQKSYAALVWTSREVTLSDTDLLDHLQSVTITQWTPLRVAHRRANAIREKVVHWMKATPVEDNRHYFVLELCTSAGCYIKEFIHGDFGRTYPCLSDLLQVEEAQCCSLDVTHVNLDLGERKPDALDAAKKKQKWENEETEVSGEVFPSSLA